MLRARVRQSEVTYGSHMATHMALGLLYLGGCRSATVLYSSSIGGGFRMGGANYDCVFALLRIHVFQN